MMNYIKFTMACILIVSIVSCSQRHVKNIAHIQSDKILNSNIYSKSSPILISVYQLKSSDNFVKAEFRELNNNPQKILGPDLLKKDNFIIKPNSKLTYNVELNPETKYVGYFAAYRNHKNKNCKVVKAITGNGNSEYKIYISDSSFIIEEDLSKYVFNKKFFIETFTGVSAIVLLFLLG